MFDAPRRLHATGRLWVNGLVVAIVALIPAVCQAQAPIVGRPILFVHGWCGEATDWSTIEPITIQYLQNLQPTLYPRSASYTLYFDGQKVRTWPDGKDILSAALPSEARFFAINFYDFLPGADPSAFNPVRTAGVANVSILNKADELAQVIAAITSLTHVKDVIVVAHSMGGLVARAYMENQGVSIGAAACSDVQFPPYSSCVHAPNTQYAQDVAKLITLDTPHAGAGVANLVNAFSGAVSAVPGQDFACQKTNTLDRRELISTSFVIRSLNNNLAHIPAGTSIAAIKSYTTPGLFFTSDDGIVSDQEQSIHNLEPVPAFSDIENFVGSFTLDNCVPLHPLSCVGIQPSTAPAIESQVGDAVTGQTTSLTIQATINGVPWSGPLNYVVGGPQGLAGDMVPHTFFDIPTGMYSLSYLSGGPGANVIQTAIQGFVGSDNAYGFNQWNSTLTLEFGSLSAQTITFVPLSDVTLGVGPFAITATASSKLPVHFDSTTTSVCSISEQTVTILATGTCSIVATQSGDSSFSAAASVTRSFDVVGGAVAVSLASSKNPSVLGRVLTVTATMAPSSATGRVTFYDGMSILGVATLEAGVASINTALEVAGNHALRAYYSGDSSFGPDKSAVLLQKVNAITGNGFSEGVNYPAGDPTSNSPSSIVTADFNDDDQADIAFANGNGVLCVFLGSGNGTFTPVGNSEDGEPVGYIEAVAAGDFNGDSVLDLAITSYKNGLAVSVLIGNGDGTFTNAGSLVTPNSLFSQSIRVADFNHDGNADIAIAGWNANGLVEVFLGNGNASFQNPVDYRVDLYPYAVAVSDFNGDGKADLAVTGGYGVSVLSGNGDGTFTPPQTFSTGVRPTTVEVGDFNGDGNNDLVTTYEGGSLSVLLGNGDGTFQTAKVDNASHGGLSIAVSDYNGDGIADLALTNGVVTVSLGVGDGTFVDLNNSTGANAHLVAPGDFNSDGIADLAFASTNSLQILLGKPGLLQAITFDPLSDVNFGVPSFTINARASSGLPVSFSSTTTNVCAMNGATVSLVAIGNCSITASQAGDETYASALPVVRNFKVSLSTCDINLDENTNVADVQLIINEALGVIPASHDLNHDGTVNVADVQKVINAALGLDCVLP